MRSFRSLAGALGLSGVVAIALAMWLMPLTPHRSSFHSHLRRILSQDQAELDVGTVLVASRELRDPNFSQTVVLLAKYDDDGSMGIVVNRLTDLPISRVLADWKEAKGRSEPVFAGGPVEKAAIFALIRSRTAPERGQSILSDVHLILERPQLQKNLSASAAPNRFRVFLGYAGWGPEQLENEIEVGAWHVLPGSASLVFDPDPDTLWSRLIRKTETHIASVSKPAAEREQLLVAGLAPVQGGRSSLGPPPDRELRR